MIGTGGPLLRRRKPHPIAVVCGLLVAWLPTVAGRAAEASAPRPVSIRIRWGGGTPHAWQGRIAVLPAGSPETDAAAALPITWRTLCTEPDAASLAHDAGGGIAVHQHRPIGSDGVELTVADWRRARLVVQLAAAATGQEAARLDVPLSDVLATPILQPLDGDGNRLTVEPAPGDALRVTVSEVAAAGGPTRPLASAVHRPGDLLRFHVDPLLSVKPDEGRFELRLRLARARDQRAIDSQTAQLEPIPEPATASATAEPLAAGDSPAGFRTGRVPTTFAGVDFELSLPEQAGVYEVSLEAIEQGSLRWTRPLASRTLQVVAIAPDPPQRPADVDWEVVYELDPGSPKLHERLRRIPTRGLPSVSVPSIPLPAMPLPSLSRPRVPLPRLPDVPLPAVPMPSMSGMVPRFGGLLAAGHSLAVPHQLGPMLRLPPAERAGEPAWEGIVVAGAQPGLPHLVEVEYPAAQSATVAVSVLEPDPAGGTVEVRHAGGFAVTPADGGGLLRHRFVFWPTSRNPVLVLANPGLDPALIGRVRVSAGPRRLPPAKRPAASGVVATAGRSTFALLGSIDLHKRFGGTASVAATGGRPSPDWVTHLTGIRHSADLLIARGLAGGVITVYEDGAATWPTPLTRQAARWDPAATGEAGLDPVPKDLLAAITAIYQREALRIVPAFCFDAAIPTLEAMLADENATGIACVGGDGRPRRLQGGIHYNPLDPRVQQAVEAVVAEGAGRLAGSPAIAGIAVLLPHDGWLHLPGVAWGLDDVTFGRFLATIGGSHEANGPERFAERARLVAGPLRDEWLAWRTGELTAFYARLARRVGGVDRRWPLYVVPTTLFTEGSLADRFRPSLSPPQADDLFREVGLVASLPANGTPGGELVFVSPHVSADGGSLRDRSTAAAANAAVARASASAGGRRGVAIISQTMPLDLATIVPHGPFGTATPPPPQATALAVDPATGDRALAEALIASDAEVVFDMRSLATLPDAMPRSRAAFESLPPLSMPLAGDLPAPLVVRSAASGGVTRIALANAGPAAARALVTFTGKPSAVLDAVESTPLTSTDAGAVSLPLAAWEVASLAIDGGVGVASVAVEYDEPVRAAAADRLAGLRRRLAVLESPAPLDVLDNPSFALGLAEPAAPGSEPAVTGWELVEARRGSLRMVPGRPAAEPAAGGTTAARPAAGRGLEFSSRNGLSTLRSNPFPPPATGRISVAAWLRIKPGDPQPPLRIAIEGVEAGREYYRFAAVGGLTGGQPLTAEWSLFVLQVDDLPTGSVDSLRARFDLLGPGSVEIDDVRIFDLAFDADQRAALAKQVARIDHRFRQGDLGGAVVGLEGHWPTYLETFIDDEAIAAVTRRAAASPPASPAPPAEPRQGMLDRLRGWWQ